MSKLKDAVLGSDLDAMKSAIASGDDLNELSGGMTPLMWAVFRGDIDAVRLLLESGADPNIRSDCNDSALWHAEDDFGLIEVAELLKSYGARK